MPVKRRRGKFYRPKSKKDRRGLKDIQLFIKCSPVPVSYTHLDVYKRQIVESAICFSVAFTLNIASTE